MDFQDGQTKIINGVTYVRQGGMWHPQTPMAPARQPSPQTPAQATGDQLQNQHTAAETARIPLQNDATRVGIAQTQQQIRNTNFDNVNNLRKQFEAEQSVQDYKTVLPLMDNAFKLGPNKAGDLNLVYAFGKAMDPNSVVREGEQVMATNVGGISEKVKGYLDQINGGAGLTPVQRTQLTEEIRNRARSLNETYNQRRAFYEDFAKRNGINPEDVVGPHPAAPFNADERAYIEAHGGHPNDGSAIPVAPGQTQAGFDQRPDPSVSNLSPEQTAAYQAFWKANPNPSPEQLVGFVHAMGIPGTMPLETAQSIIAAKKAGRGISTDVVVKPDITDVRGQNNASDSINAAVRGVLDTPTSGLIDKGVALGDTLTKGGTFDQNLARQYAISDYDQQNHPWMRFGGQALGAGLIPMGEMSSVPQIALKSGAVGGAYGIGSSRSASDVPMNALMGFTGGAATGGALAGLPNLLGAGARAVGRRIAGPAAPEQQAILQAGQQERVPVNMADVYPETRNAVATLESMPGASGPVRQGIEAGRQAMEARVADLSRGGVARENIGQSIQDSGRKFVKDANKQASRLYKQAEAQSAGVPVKPNNVLSTLNSLLAQENATPGGTRAGAVIRQYADDFAKRGNITIEGARSMRSELAARLRQDGGLSKKQATRVTGQIMDAVNTDIGTALTAAGRPNAAKAYQFADKFYAQSRAEIEQNIQKFIGTEDRPFSVEQTISAMNNAAGPKGNARALTGMLARMSKADRADYAATLAEGLGRKSPEEPFSAQTFISSVRRLSPAARRIIFGADGEKSIQNLMTLANAKKGTMDRLNNSASGRVINYRSVISNLLFGLPGGGAVAGAAMGLNGPTGVAGGAAISGAMLVGSRAMAKAFMNEDFTRAIANTPATTSPKAINAHFGRLRQIAAKDPNVRSVVESLEKALINHANDNAIPALAASNTNTQDQ